MPKNIHFKTYNTDTEQLDFGLLMNTECEKTKKTDECEELLTEVFVRMESLLLSCMHVS